MASGDYLESEIVYMGTDAMEILLNEYQGGDSITLKYRHADTPEGVLVASWLDYSGSFDSLGYVQARIERA